MEAVWWSVVYDEARVDRLGVSGVVDEIDGVDVPSDPVAGLEHRDLVRAVQEVSGDEPGYATTYDRDAHDLGSVSGSEVGGGGGQVRRPTVVDRRVSLQRSIDSSLTSPAGA